MRHSSATHARAESKKSQPGKPYRLAARSFHTPVGGAVEWSSSPTGDRCDVARPSALYDNDRPASRLWALPGWLFLLSARACVALLCRYRFLIAARVFQGLGGALLLSTRRRDYHGHLSG